MELARRDKEIEKQNRKKMGKEHSKDKTAFELTQEYNAIWAVLESNSSITDV